MLDSLFAYPRERERLRRGPLGPHLDSFVAVVAALGYARTTMQGQVLLLHELSLWLMQRNLATRDLDEAVVETFRAHHQDLNHHAPTTFRRLLAQLRVEGLIPPLAEQSCEQSATEKLEENYAAYLKSERGLAQVTIDGYLQHVHRFLIEHRIPDGLMVEAILPAQVSDFVLRHAHARSPSRARLTVCALRSFFRYLTRHGAITADLASCVPTVANWKLAPIPRHLPAEDVERLLRSCNRESSRGRRDYAILLLLARLGLRSGETAAMELGDIDWRAGEILVRGKGGVHARLPLLHEVGDGLSTYLREARPCAPTRHVFVSVYAPRRPLHQGAIGDIVRRALKRADLHPAVTGAQLLRHSLATNMLRGGAKMAEIGQVLRHQSAQTTEIYAKLDTSGLRVLAQPWTGSGGKQ